MANKLLMYLFFFADIRNPRISVIAIFAKQMLRSFAFWKLQYVYYLKLFYFQKIKANCNPRDMTS